MPSSMKRHSLLLSAAILVFIGLGGCQANIKGRPTEDEVRNIVREEFSSEEFGTKVREGIDTFVKQEEEKAKKQQEEANKPKQVPDVSVDDDPVLGSADAPVTIVEFSDYECPFCGRNFAQTYPELKKTYIDTGKVKLVFRDFPLGFHQKAIPAAVAANCARDQSDDATYFAYHDKLFANQEKLGQEFFVSLAKELSLDETAFTTCLASGKFDAEIKKDMEDGAKYGVNGTPAFFINGWLLSGAQPFPAFQELIEQELGGGTAAAASPAASLSPAA